MIEFHSASAAATEAVGAALAQAAPAGAAVHLCGELGSGKTTLVRGFLRGLGWTGRVVSPTYTLVEPYAEARQPVYHLDLYRLQQPEELEAIGWRDYQDGRSLCLVEWPERAGTLLPQPELRIELVPQAGGRHIRLIPGSAAGRAWLDRVSWPTGLDPSAAMHTSCKTDR